jgi:hypothetical protein
MFFMPAPRIQQATASFPHQNTTPQRHYFIVSRWYTVPGTSTKNPARKADPCFIQNRYLGVKVFSSFVNLLKMRYISDKNGTAPLRTEPAHNNRIILADPLSLKWSTLGQ